MRTWIAIFVLASSERMGTDCGARAGAKRIESAETVRGNIGGVLGSMEPDGPKAGGYGEGFPGRQIRLQSYSGAVHVRRTIIARGGLELLFPQRGKWREAA